jgi:hypothetical protein
LTRARSRVEPGRPPEKTDEATLARLVRASPTLDPIARRQWLDLLPYLNASDRRRLAEILRDGAK